MENSPQNKSYGIAVARVLASVLERLVKENDHIEQGPVSKFHALRVPGISIHQYLERIHRWANCSPECFVLALIYIDRLIQGGSSKDSFILTKLNVHRVVITSVLLAAKFFDDVYYNNAFYAKLGGVLVSEMNNLEIDFVFRINFSLHVKPEVFSKYHAELASHAVDIEVKKPLMNVSLTRSPQSSSCQSTLTSVSSRSPSFYGNGNCRHEEKRADENPHCALHYIQSNVDAAPMVNNQNSYLNVQAMATVTDNEKMNGIAYKVTPSHIQHSSPHTNQDASHSSLDSYPPQTNAEVPVFVSTANSAPEESHFSQSEILTQPLQHSYPISGNLKIQPNRMYPCNNANVHKYQTSNSTLNVTEYIGLHHNTQQFSHLIDVSARCRFQ